MTLFAKILKNECDEDFRFIQVHVRDTLGNLLKILLREKYHLKSEGEIVQMCDAIQNNGFINDAYWRKIVSKMYDREDVRTLTARFQEAINAKKNQVMLASIAQSPQLMKENKNSQMVSTSSNNPLRPGKLTRDDEVKLKKQQGLQGKLLY